MDLKSIHPETNHKDTLLKAEKFLDNLLVRTNFALKTRTALGWRGLHPSVRNGNGWTCKIRGNEGIYGIHLQACNEDDAHFQLEYGLSYFPLPEEETRMLFATETALLPGHPAYMDYVRNFMCYPEFNDLFHIAKIHITLQKNKRDFVVVSLKGQRKLRTISKEGIYNNYKDEEICLVEPNGIDQDLPAFHLAYPFFEVLSATLTYNLSDAPKEIFYTKDILNEKQPEEALLLGLVFGNSDNLSQTEPSSNSANIIKWSHRLVDSRPFDDAGWWTAHLSLSQNINPHTVKAIDRPQLIVLTGFLGSGKTTFLKNFIEYHTQNNRFVAVIQNEIGQKGLDASMLEDSFGVMEMDEGCVCCSLAGQLRKGIQQIQQSYNPDVIILETTGLANPYNLLDEISEVKDLVRFDSITTVVDMLNIESFMRESHIAEDQIKAADILLLNKTDLISQTKKEALKTVIKNINSDALVLESIKCAINPALIYVADKDEITVTSPVHMHENHMHEHMGSVKVDISLDLDRKNFERYIENIPPGIFRSKGRISFSDSDKLFVFQYVNGRYDLEEYSNTDVVDRYLIFIGKKEALKQIDLSIF